MNDIDATPSARYGRALAALACALILSIALRGPSTVPLLMLAAVAYAAWFGGFAPGLLVTALSSTIVTLIFYRAGELPSQLAAPILFFGVALLLVWLFTSTGRSNDAGAPDTSAGTRNATDAATASAATDEAARTSFLAGAGELLAGSLDYEETLKSVARLAVPHIADWCSIDIIKEEGGFEPLVVAHVDPAKVEWARELQEKYPPDPDAPNGLPNVLRTGHPEFYPLVTEEMIQAAVKDQEMLDIVHQIGYTSVMIVPLIARGRTLGAITLVSAESGRRYSEADFALAQDLARMAGLAMDNARLFREAGAQREWFEVTLDSIGDAVIATDGAGTITFMNTVAQQLTAWPSADAIGRGLPEVFAIINETTLRTVEDPVARVLREGTVVGLANHTLLVDRNGGHLPIDDSAAPIRGRDGSIAGVVLVFHDVSDRRIAETQLQQSRDQLDVILRSVAEGITVQDRSGRLIFANEEAARIAGCSSADELIAAPADMIAARYEMSDEQGNPFPVELLPGRRALRGETNASTLIRFRHRPSNELRWTIIRANPVFDDQGNVTLAINVFHDITERKRTEEELRRSYEQLRDIYDLSEAATRAESPSELDSAALDSIERMLGADRAAILLFDDRGTMRFRSWRNLSDRYRKHVDGHSPWARDAKNPEPVLVPDVAEDEGLAPLRATIEEEGIAALCFIPLVYRDRLIGKFMVYFDRPHRFAEEEIRIAETVARHVAFALGRRRDEEAIRFQANLLDTVEQGVIATDLGGGIIFWNRFAEILYGWRSDEVMGKSIMNFTVPENESNLGEEIMERVASGLSWTGEFTVRRRDGSTFPAWTTLTPIYSGEGEMIGMVGVSLDITERKTITMQLQDETESLEKVNKIGQILSAELDLRKLLQAVTDAATELSGARFGSFFYNRIDRTEESYMLYTLSGVGSERFKHFPMPRATELFGPTFRGEGNVRIDDVRKDPRYGKSSPYYGIPPGHLPVVSYLAVPVISRNGEVVGGLFFGHPEPGVFTERAERIVSGLAAQSAIAIDNARLFMAAQEEIAERKRTEEELKLAKEQAEAANAAKDQFLAVLSHELRTPLTPVLSSVYAIETGEPIAAGVRQYIEIIRRNVELEARLIDDLLDLTRISKGKLQLDVETADAHALMRYVLEICQGEIDEKGLRLTMDLAAPRHFVQADPARLQQVYWNLVKNAVKFTSAGGAITIRSFNTEGDQLAVEVADSGIGIEASLLPRIFNAFEQGEQTITRRFGGLGLGLAISKALIDMHGGELAASSEGPGKGATFQVFLATTEASFAGGTNGAGAPQAAHAPEMQKILIVDDHVDTSRVMKLLLERRGYEVFTAHDVRSALELASTQPFDLLISDIGLPDGSGVELMQKLRQERPVKGIALSGFGMEDDVRRSKEAGFIEHLTKPVSFHRLVSAIEEIIPPGPP